MSMEQQYMCFLFQGFGTNHYIIPTFMNVQINHQTPIYGTFSQQHKQLKEEQENNLHINQDNQSGRSKERLSKPVKMIRKKYYSKTKNQQTKQTKEKRNKKSKVYLKDKDRNVLPNALSKIFFFLRSVAKSKDILQKILDRNPRLSHYVNVSKYYTYQNVLRADQKRFKTEESLKKLFNLIDEQYEIFSLQEQLSFIKINSIMLRYYLRNHLYFYSLISSPRSPRDKMKVYIEKYRKISQKIDQYIIQSKITLNFSLIAQQVTH